MKRNRSCKIVPEKSMNSSPSHGEKVAKTKPEAKSGPSPLPDKNTRQGNKRKKSSDRELKVKLQPINVKKRPIHTVINEVVSESEKDEVKIDEETPWANFQPFSPRKSSWMLQEIYNSTKDNKRIIDEMLLSRSKFRKLNPQETDGPSKWVNGCGTEEKNNGGKANESEEETDVDETDEEEKIEVDEGEAETEAETIKMSESKYPLNTTTDLDEMEEMLRKDSSYFPLLIKNLGLSSGSDSQEMLNIFLKFFFSNNLAFEFSYVGNSKKRSFKSLGLFEAIKKAVRVKYPNTAESYFADRIKSWLDGCKRKVRMETAMQ